LEQDIGDYPSMTACTQDENAQFHD
jgi:hypothetical protein